MADDNAGDQREVAFQREITRLVLAQIGSAGFALAGSGAIREHGITDRPTRDVDLFATAATSRDRFADAAAAAERVLSRAGYAVTRTRSTSEFARLLVEAGHGAAQPMAVEIDLGIDWRREPPTQLAIGPVLGVRDAVASKVAAVYSRGEVRDYLDLDSIRLSQRFTDHELITLVQEHDPGFDVSIFVAQLRRVSAFGAVETAEYGVDAEQLASSKHRLTTWAAELAASGSPPAPQAPMPGRDEPSLKRYPRTGRPRDIDPPTMSM